MKKLILFLICSLITSISFAQDEATVTIDDCWLEHNVYVNNQKGMKICCHLNVEQMRGKTLCVIAYFSYDDGENTPVKSRTGNSKYKTRDNQVCTGDYAYAKYDSTYWDGFTLFLPYRELNSAVSCSSDLSCIISVQSKSGIPYAISDVMTFTFNK